jgi:hypothetical protein
VVNIDNGFGAGYQASLINRRVARGSQTEGQRESGPLPKVSLVHSCAARAKD